MGRGTGRHPVVSCRIWQLIVILLLLSGSVRAQDSSAPGSLRHWFASTDSTLLHDIYTLDRPVVTGYLEGVHRTAVPVVVGGTPAVAAGEWLSGSREWQAPAALLAAQGTGYVLQYGLKRLIRRSRPYVAYPSIQSRSSYFDLRDSFGMPSGHATLAFATATSLSLAYPHWYVAAPSAVWAGSVALSRPWLGVHYPSDIVAGAVLGTVVGIGIHFLIPELLPRRLK